MQIEDLLSGSASGHALGTKRSSFHGGLQFGMPSNRGQVEKVEDAGDGSSTDHIVEEIGINAGGGNA